MKFNPNFLAIFAFLVIGLIWSGGHVGWLIAMGVLCALSVWGGTINQQNARRR